jgi:hypothetical protein
VARCKLLLCELHRVLRSPREYMLIHVETTADVRLFGVLARSAHERQDDDSMKAEIAPTTIARDSFSIEVVTAAFHGRRPYAAAAGRARSSALRMGR